jgi:hypothetical protein
MQHLRDRGHIPLDPLKVPAPNHYEPHKDNLKLGRAPTFSMRRRLPVIDRTMSIEPQNVNPGAGRYENPEALSPRGRYSVSKHKGTGASLFNPKRSVRFFQFRTPFSMQPTTIPALESTRRSTIFQTAGTIRSPTLRDGASASSTRNTVWCSLRRRPKRTKTQALEPTELLRILDTTMEMSIIRLEQLPIWYLETVPVLPARPTCESFTTDLIT